MSGIWRCCFVGGRLMLDGIKALHGRRRKRWKGHCGGIIVGISLVGTKWV